MNWFDSHSEVLRFGRALWEGGSFGESIEGVDNLFYYLEKPWKYDREHDEWLKKGEPASFYVEGA